MSRRSASRSASSSSRAIRWSPAGELKKGSVVTCEVTEVKEGGIEVKIVGTDLTAFIRRADLARDRGDQRPERFAVGQKVDARVTQFDRKTRKVAVSIKALEIAEEKEAIAQYGSSDSGASLGDILGAALKQRDDKAETKRPRPKRPRNRPIDAAAFPAAKDRPPGLTRGFFFTTCTLPKACRIPAFA